MYKRNSALVLLIILKIKQLRTCHSSNKKTLLQKQIKKLLLIYRYIQQIKKKKVNRKQWVRPLFSVEKRETEGFTKIIFDFCEEYDPEMFRRYLKITPEQFNKLLELIKDDLTKQDFIRMSISAKTRLQVFLRYLVTGCSMISLTAEFRLGHSTVCDIIGEVAEVVYNRLFDLVFIKPSPDEWLEVAEEFEDIWQIPHCIGAIDGRHMVLQVFY